MKFAETALPDIVTTFVAIGFILYHQWRLAAKDKQIADLQAQLLLLKLAPHSAKKSQSSPRDNL